LQYEHIRHAARNQAGAKENKTCHTFG
jgi:hypothetical protein